MNLTEEQLKEVERFAYCYLSRTEIATILNVNATDFIGACVSDSVISASFNRGRLLRKAEFNQRVMKLTDQLSSPAMGIEHKLMEEAQLNDIKNQ